VKRRSAVARTIRFPTTLRARIAADARRCGRSFEAHIIALLRRHFGEDVDIAPSAEETLRRLRDSVAGISDDDQEHHWGRRRGRP
jgi:hypothetical protein